MAAPTARPEQAKPAEEAADRFLQALADGEFDAAWEMLAAAPRQAWGDPAAFAGFLARKVGGLDLSFSLGEPAAAASWQDAETGALYPEALLVPLRLEVDGREMAEFSLTPLALVSEEGQWRLAGLGPAGRRAPVLPPSPPPSAADLQVPILVYHHVRPVWPDDFEGRTMTVLTPDFEGQLTYLRDAGYRTVTLSELANALFYALPLPPEPVVITLDDGYEDAYTDAFPLLQRYGFTASFALATGLVGGPGYLTWEQAKEMAAAGMEFVSHTVSHADLGSLAPQAAAAQVRDSRAAIQEQLGQPVQALIYPFGEPFAHGSIEQQQAVVRVLQQEGYAIAVTNPLPGEPPQVSQRADLPYQLSRVNVSGGLPLNRFAARLEGRDIY